MHDERFARLPQPPYYAVVFSSRRRGGEGDGYAAWCGQSTDAIVALERRLDLERAAGAIAPEDAGATFVWIGLRRVNGEVYGHDAISGRIPNEGELNVEGLDITSEQLNELFALDPAAWQHEADLTEEYFKKFGDKVPQELWHELTWLRNRTNGVY